MSETNVKLEKASPIKIAEWQHAPSNKFLGANRRNIDYEFGISKPDIFTGIFDFVVIIIVVYTNQFNGQVFKSRSESQFLIKYVREAPTFEFLFNLVDHANLQFAKVFHSRVYRTNLMMHQIDRPQVKDLRQPIQELIDDWDSSARKFKARGGRRLSKFKDLPAIPENKSYTEGLGFTSEQLISFKLLQGQEVTEEELRIFESLGGFYEELNRKLQTLNYQSFSKDDIIGFHNYIQYALNYHVLVSNEITVVRHLYRVTINENVTGKNERVFNTKYLSYPPLEIVKKLGKYNRANTPDATVLYLTESIDAALKEIHPLPNKLITVSIWAPKNSKTFLAYPVDHSGEAALVNSEVAKGREAFKTLGEKNHPLLARYMDNYFGLLAREYSKPISNHYEYMLSALLSDSILELNDYNPNFKYECIAYPSVGNNFITRNIAVKSDVADNKLTIVKVMEFEVVSANYDKTPQSAHNPELITIAQIKNLAQTTNIEKDGTINW